jgi:hypothetical protein
MTRFDRDVRRERIGLAHMSVDHVVEATRDDPLREHQHDP